MNFDEILFSVDNNPHYLKRYISFIEYCKNVNQNQIKTYSESHHICPRNLFPQYYSFSKNPWNKIVLTPRQHYIAHWILWKAYGKGMAFAFKSMHNQKNSRQKERYLGYSHIYECVKRETNRLSSEKNKGFASYYDKDGNTVRVKTTDPRVISGEFISTSKGRKVPKSKECREKLRKSAMERYKTKEIKKISLYKDTNKITVLEYAETTQTLLENGWSKKCTTAYRSKMTAENNRKGKGKRNFSEKAKERLRKIGRECSQKGELNHNYGKIHVSSKSTGKRTMIFPKDFDDTIHIKGWKNLPNSQL